MTDQEERCCNAAHPMIPQPKNLVLCFDGTDKTFGPDPFTNVLKIFRMLESSNDLIQMCYYQPGIGTNTSFLGHLSSGVKHKFINSLDSMFAFTLDRHIISAYLFLMENYEAGDKIIMFGFSRGAFTARVLTGMLERVGILKRGLEDLATMAWKIYEAWEYAAQPSPPHYTTTLIDEFRSTFARNITVRVHFQGLFDSVNSCGIIRDRLFPYTSRSGIVDHVRHAVSVDERRGKFKQQSFSPNPYTQKLFSFVYRNYVVETNHHTPDELDRTADDLYLNPFISKTLVRTRSVPQFSTTSDDLLGECQKGNSNSADLLRNVNDFLANGAGRANQSSWFRRKLNAISRQRVEGVFQRYSPETSSTEPGTFVSADMVEKWFPGDHSDVGGGWAPDTETEHFISNLPLRWILSEAIKHGVYFKKGVIHQFANSYDSAGSLLSASHDMLSWRKGRFTMKSPFSSSHNPSQQDLDTFHGLLKMPDRVSSMLRIFTGRSRTSMQTFASHATPVHRFKTCNYKAEKNDGHGAKSRFQVFLWWLVELIALGIRIEDETCKWRNVYVPNLGRHRNIPDYGEMHWSIYWRCKFVGDYKPKNLPPYAARLIDTYIGVTLEDKNRNRKNEVSISSKHVSFPFQDSSPPIDNEVDFVCCERTSMEIDFLSEADEQKLRKWIETGWKVVPDDLEEVLMKNPDL